MSVKILSGALMILGLGLALVLALVLPIRREW